MTRSRSRRGAWMLAAWLASADLAGAAPATGVAAELRRQTQALLDAVGKGDVAVWRRLADERLVHVDETGAVRTKAALLAEMRPLPPGLVGSLQVEAFAVEQHGNVAVATHEDHERLDYYGQMLDSRFRTTDTWVRVAGSGWQLIASQVIALQQDPPAIAMTREALCGYAGQFVLDDATSATVRCVDQGLSIERTGRPPVVYRPEATDVFFAKGEPRTRRIFQRDAAGAIVGFVDRREGRDIRWRRVAAR